MRDESKKRLRKGLPLLSFLFQRENQTNALDKNKISSCSSAGFFRLLGKTILFLRLHCSQRKTLEKRQPQKVFFFQDLELHQSVKGLVVVYPS